MKIYILFDFVDGPYGGGNQFLKALRYEFIRKDCLADNPENTNVVLFNSHHCLSEVIKLKKRYPGKIFFHRVDGPMVYRGENGEKIDKTIFSLNKFIADGTIFQSEWSRLESYKQGMLKNNYETVIHNAPDPEIFFPSSNGQKNPSGKIKLIATSWSDNPGKGFDIYHFLDKNLDFKMYEMTFVGRVDRQFKNIKMIPPVSSSNLAAHLRQHDIFVFASKLEACSNSLVEALNCGLPSVVMNTSSNPEILDEKGLTFDGKEDILAKIKMVADNLDYYNNKLNMPSIEEITENYCQFFEAIFSDIRNGVYRTKRLRFFEVMKLKTI